MDAREVLKELYIRTFRLRRVEERIAELYAEQEMRCPTHLCTGQEALEVGVGFALEDGDVVFGTHRGHGHYLGRGGDLKTMLAELYGKAAGCSGGKGGSMHLADPSRGHLGASAIVGGSVPLAVGAALSFQLQGKDRVAVAFMGDAALEQGVVHESFNFASLRKLPVLFVVENNLYATHTHVRERQPGGIDVARRALAHDLKAERTEGTDPLTAWETARDAAQRARAGKGPSLIEGRVYRYKEHVGPGEDYTLGYRDRAELEKWLERDPVKTFRAKLLKDGAFSENELGVAERAVEREIDEAVSFAKNAPAPDPAAATLDVFA